LPVTMTSRATTVIVVPSPIPESSIKEPSLDYCKYSVRSGIRRKNQQKPGPRTHRDHASTRSARAEPGQSQWPPPAFTLEVTLLETCNSVGHHPGLDRGYAARRRPAGPGLRSRSRDASDSVSTGKCKITGLVNRKGPGERLTSSLIGLSCLGRYRRTGRRTGQKIKRRSSGGGGGGANG
jgi:hypothetical protein